MPPSSIYRGVHWKKKRKKWRAAIFREGRTECLGDFNDEVEAAKAYDRAAQRYRDKPTLNFLQDGSLNPDRKRKACGTSSRYRGVGKKIQRSGGAASWEARIYLGGRRKLYLGSFTSEEAAARAHDRAAVEAGRLDLLNFPEEAGSSSSGGRNAEGLKRGAESETEEEEDDDQLHDDDDDDDDDDCWSLVGISERMSEESSRQRSAGSTGRAWTSRDERAMRGREATSSSSSSSSSSGGMPMPRAVGGGEATRGAPHMPPPPVPPPPSFHHQQQIVKQEEEESDDEVVFLETRTAEEAAGQEAGAKKKRKEGDEPRLKKKRKKADDHRTETTTAAGAAAAPSLAPPRSRTQPQQQEQVKATAEETGPTAKRAKTQDDSVDVLELVRGAVMQTWQALPMDQKSTYTKALNIALGAEELPHETQAKIRRFARTALQSSRTPLDLDTDEGTAALARTFSEACETGLFG